MAVNNSLQKKNPKFSVAIQTEGYQKLINNTLGDPERAKRFVAAVTSAVSINPALQKCEASSILSAALLGESLNLSPSPQLGQYYMVPFGNKAQFILGYKGYIQLAIRSGQYKKLNVVAIKKGELISFDPLTEEIEVELIKDEGVREKTPTIGYYAFFKYINGFEKAIYWSKEQMEIHADKYSSAFKLSEKRLIDAGNVSGDGSKYSSFWYKDFDAMAFKTMLRQLISKWGIMSLEMQKAFENDNADEVIKKEEYINVESETVGDVATLEADSNEYEDEKPELEDDFFDNEE